MIDIISDTKQKARKDHKCNYCNQPILKGESYHAMVLKYDDIYQWKSHLRCDKIASKLKMFDYSDEGVTDEYFHECINEAYYNLTEEDALKTSFAERLDFVCNHYLITP